MSIIGAFVVPHPPLIIPEVGRGQENEIQNTFDAYEEFALRIAALAPETVVIVSPHSVMYADYFHISPGAHAQGSFARFGAPQVSFEVDYDEAFAAEIQKEALKTGIAAGTLGEKDKSLDHGTLIPLAFIQKRWIKFSAVRVSVSGLDPTDHYRLGMSIKAAAARLGRKTVIVASGDMSHRLKDDGPYGFSPEGPIFDKAINASLAAGAFDELLSYPENLCEDAGECGLRSFIIMAGGLDGQAVNADFLSYEGPFGVGYSVFSFTPGEADEERHFLENIRRRDIMKLEGEKAGEDGYVRLARQSLENYVRTGRMIPLPDELSTEIAGRRAGVFVSLKKHGRLRGCIGTISPVRQSIGLEILHNAVSAGTGDPRFPPVREEELDELSYSVDVLGEPEAVADKAMLDVKRYGVIVTNGTRRGLLLPNLEGVDSVEEQLSIALQKAGIGESESYAIERFEVVRHK